MRTLTIAAKDLRQILRDWKSALFLVLMPVAFTLLFGLAFRSRAADTRIPVGWIDGDPGGRLSVGLRGLLEGTGAVRLEEMAGDEAARADRLVRNERLAAVVEVPEGFTEKLLAGEPVVPSAIAVTGSTVGQAATTAVQTASRRLLGALQAARLSAEGAAARGGDGPAAFERALEEALSAWQQPPLSVVDRPATAVAATTQAAEGFAQSSPGMMVQFAVFGLVSSAMVVVLERKSGAMRRLLTAPVRRAEIVAGHALAIFAVVLLQEGLLVALGQLALGVDYLRQPLAAALILACLALWAAALGLLIGAIARAEEQVVALSLIAMFLFSALGGAWFPLATAGAGFSRVGHLLPTAWAMEGLQNLLVRGQGLGSVLLPAGILVAYSAVFLGLAVWRFRFE